MLNERRAFLRRGMLRGRGAPSRLCRSLERRSFARCGGSGAGSLPSLVCSDVDRINGRLSYLSALMQFMPQPTKLPLAATTSLESGRDSKIYAADKKALGELLRSSRVPLASPAQGQSPRDRRAIQLQLHTRGALEAVRGSVLQRSYAFAVSWA